MLVSILRRGKQMVRLLFLTAGLFQVGLNNMKLTLVELPQNVNKNLKGNVFKIQFCIKRPCQSNSPTCDANSYERFDVRFNFITEQSPKDILKKLKDIFYSLLEQFLKKKSHALFVLSRMDCLQTCMVYLWISLSSIHC